MAREGDGLRVLFITGEYPPMEGGVADYTYLLAEHLIALGVDAAVLTDRRAAGGPNPPAPFPRREGGDGGQESGEGPVSDSRLPRPLREGRREGPTVYAHVRSWGFRCWRDAGDAVAAFRPDVVHVQYQTGAYGLQPAINFLPFWLRRLARRPAVVVTFHDLRTPYLFPKAGRLRLLVNRALAAGADAVTATNVEDELALQTMVPEHRVRAIPIPPNVPAVALGEDECRRLRARLGIGEGVALVAYFGLVNRSKGLPILLEAVRRLRDEHRRVDLVMIGGGVGATDPTNASELAHVRATVRELGLEPVVHWTGWLPPLEASRLLAACDAVALPYRDGASVRRATLLAALANGLPTVTTVPATPAALTVPGQPDRQIADGREALLVPPDDPTALAGALRQALFDPSCRDRLRRSALVFAEAFTWQRVARLTLELYQAAG